MHDILRAGRNLVHWIIFLQLVHVAASAPIDENRADPARESTDIWASVIANVAPLMALVGERNAKEFMRTVSTWHQLLLLSCAPVGILAILISSIRLSGPGFLKRLAGRDSERRSEALVEVTSLSVRPATSVYTSRAVEIETTFNKTGVAFVGGHVREADSGEAIDAFQRMLRSHVGTIDEDKDMESVLAIWSKTLPLNEIASLIDSVVSPGSDCSTILPANASAAVSYRTTGISPTQRENNFARSWYGVRNLLTFATGLAMTIGVQVLGLRYGGTAQESFYMGLAGYLAIVTFTFLLLIMVTQEIILEKQTLASCFDKAIWSFSNASHTEHRAMQRPTSNALITARPFEPTSSQRFWREIATTCMTGCLIGSYVVYYIAMRVSPWWVSLSSVGITWLAALYRALFSPTTIVALPNGLQSNEHWIGMFRRTLSDSLLATLEGAHQRPLPSYSVATCPPTVTASGNSDPDDFVVVEPKTPYCDDQKIDSHMVLLLIHQPTRIALNSWSGAEDVIKVGLQIAQLACQTHINSFPSHVLSPTSPWLRLVRMKLIIYIPGLMWRSDHHLDMPLPKEFTLSDIIRHLLKMLHVCMDHTGEISRHAVSEEDAVELSHVLCGTIADPPIHKDFVKTTATLREVMTAIRDNERNRDSHKFSVEQTLLIPTIMLATAYDRWLWGRTDVGGFGHEIQFLQRKNTAQALTLSGAKWLPTLQKELQQLNILEVFMMKIDAGNQVELDGKLAARDGTAGNYSVHNKQREDGKDPDEMEA